jgi:hypothetical protein
VRRSEWSGHLEVSARNCVRLDLTAGRCLWLRAAAGSWPFVCGCALQQFPARNCVCLHLYPTNRQCSGRFAASNFKAPFVATPLKNL